MYHGEISMALISCPECGHHPLSDRAEKCPNCSCPIAGSARSSSAGLSGSDRLLADAQAGDLHSMAKLALALWNDGECNTSAFVEAIGWADKFNKAVFNKIGSTEYEVAEEQIREMLGEMLQVAADANRFDLMKKIQTATFPI
jgi:hypothetical protein